MPHQPFFVPYSSQVCPADVQTVEEPFEESQISLFLYLFVALFLFVNYIRVNHRQRPIIIGFSVLLSVNGVVASDASATTEEPGWFMRIIDYLYEHPWIIVVMAVIVFLVLCWVFYACFQFCMEQLPRTNNNNVAPNANVAYIVGTDQVHFNAGDPHREMPHQPFFVPYSSQACSVDVQTLEEPSEESQISLFLYLFVALVLFVNRGRIARHPQISFIIGFLVLLFVGVVFASDASATSATSTISTTYEAIKDGVWSFWQDYVLIVDLALIVGMAILGLVTYTCFVYWQRRRDNRNAVRPQLIAGFLVLLSVNGAVASDASAITTTSSTSTISTTNETLEDWVWSFWQEHETLVRIACILFFVALAALIITCSKYWKNRWDNRNGVHPRNDVAPDGDIVINPFNFNFGALFPREVHQNPNNNNNVVPYVNAGYVVGTDEVHFNVDDPQRDNQNPDQQ
ncbi:unnamed protein product [Caenorhabditis brenneri]